MTAYIPYHEKKIRIFEKREQELRHAIINNYSKDKIERCAEKLKTAKLNVFKSRFSENSSRPPHSYIPNKKAKEWESLSINEIIQKYL